jgi:hypothetical protein
MYRLRRTEPFRAFQKSVGNATFHLNSSYVGLEWIARGYGKPEDLEIAWTPPKEPKHSVNQSRSFLHAAALSHVADALDTYLRDIADEKYLALTEGQGEVLRKSKTGKGGHEYSVPERFSILGLELSAESNADLAMVAALAAWRNRSTHSRRDRRLSLEKDFEEGLRAAKTLLATRYGDLDSAAMLQHMHAREAPKRKEIVALVSVAQNFVRVVDEALLRAALPDEAAIRNVAHIAIRSRLCPETGVCAKSKNSGAETSMRGSGASRRYLKNMGLPRVLEANCRACRMPLSGKSQTILWPIS